MRSFRAAGLVVFLCLGLVLGVTAFAQVLSATIYVGPDGTPDGDGTLEKPFSRKQLVEKANKESFRAGTEIIFRDGVYSTGATPHVRGAILDLKNFKGGNWRHHIIIRAENKHKAIFEGSLPLKDWKKVKRTKSVWECEVEVAPIAILVNGEPYGGWMLRDLKPDQELREGMWRMLPRDADTNAKKPQPGRIKGAAIVRVWPWESKKPTEGYALYPDTLLGAGGTYVTFDGFVLRRSHNGVGLGGRHQIIRNCVIRDVAGQGFAGGGRGFNLIEDCIIYNIGCDQRDHGIYASGQSHRLTLRRNIWWRISGGAIHLYSGGEGIDEPARITAEYNIIGPDKLGRCWDNKLKNPYNKKSAAFYIYGGKRWAGYDRVTNNIIFGGHARGISMHKCHFNLIANNVFLDVDDYVIQIGNSTGDFILNNIMEPGRIGYYRHYADGGLLLRAGHNLFLPAPGAPKKTQWRMNLQFGAEDEFEDFTSLADLLKQDPNWENGSKVATKDPFVNRAALDFHLRADSEAVDLGIVLPNLHKDKKGEAPDIGALELGEEMFGEKGKYPEIPAWLLKEWPISKRKEQEKFLK